MERRGVSRVLIVDDHPIVLQGLAQLISHEDDLEVCGEAGDSETALTLASQHRPDIAVIDLMLKGSADFHLIRTLRARHRDLPVLVISMHDEAVYVERALRAGAHGYIMKEEATELVLTAIRKVLAGDVYVSERMIPRILRRLVGGGSSDGGVDRLSDRELEVFRWIGRGLSVSDIAGRLKVSPKTVESYRAHIKDKLGLASANEVVRMAASWLEQQSAGS